jgi:hypothetical protein
LSFRQGTFSKKLEIIKIFREYGKTTRAKINLYGIIPGPAMQTLLI